MTSVQPAAAAGARVPLANIFTFAAPGLPVAALLLTFAVYLPRYYVSLGVAFTAVAAAIFVVRMVDMVFDPLIALAMDRTKTPIGRYRPWMIAGAPLILLGVYKLLMPEGRPDALYLIVWLLVTYVGNSMLTLGIAAWSAALATTYNDRSRLFGWTQALAVIGSISLLVLPLLTHGRIVPGKAASMPTIGWILIVALPIALLICTALTPERLAAVSRLRFGLGDYFKAIGRPSMLRIILADLALTLGPGTTAPLYVYFFHDAKGFNIADVGLLLIAYIGAGVLGAPLWARVAHRIGKHRTVQVACVSYGVAQTTLMALPRVWPGYGFADAAPTIVGMFAVGFVASAFALMIRAMVADVADEVRLEQKQDLTSLLYSMVTTTTKIGATITVLAVFPVLQWVGYNGKEGAVNTHQAIFGLEMCYLFAPIVLVFFGGAALFGYKLDATRHSQIRAALDEREMRLHVAAAEETLVEAAE